MGKIKNEKLKMKNHHSKFKIIFFGYGVVLISLFFYSFTQVDLNLTLSKISFWFAFQDFFQYIGFFQRPLSTLFYLSIIFLLFTFYFLLLRLVKKNKMTERQFWLLVYLTAGILLFSYPAFSYDLFNYVFDARIFTKYHLNPYHFKALDFPQDPWTRFMHWTHRTYPYGPSWLILSIPLSFLGMEKFLPTLYLFKLLSSLSYLGNIFLLGKILAEIAPSEKIYGMAFFALSPLVIIETLVSAHHESVMIFLTLTFIYSLIKGKKMLSFLSYLLSAGIKYVTSPLLPLLIVGFRKKLALVLMTISFLIGVFKKELQPWYFLWVFPFIALEERKWLKAFSVFFSFGLLLRYTPFLYFGHWNDPVPRIKFWVTIIPIALFFLGWIFYVFIERSLGKKGE